MGKKLTSIVVFGLIVAAALWESGVFTESTGTQGDATIVSAYENRQSDVQVAGEGVVVKVLPDDTVGSRHQKFILKLGSGHSVLVAHNIDLAERIPSLREGDRVAFCGEYEWNVRGGVIHWTHPDPRGKHPAGWVKRR